MNERHNVTIGFHGAARTVTGSKYLVRAGGEAVLVDCGLFQGLKELRERNWLPPGFRPGDPQAVLLTHTHIDHVGYLPRLVSQGFSKPVYATPATIDLARILLPDAAHIQEEDARFLNKKKLTRHQPALPLFDARDAERALALLRPVRPGEWLSVGRRFRARWRGAGHLLGSAFIELVAEGKNGAVTVLFSGDIGRYGAPLTLDPEPPGACDALILESTYGDRRHPEVDPLVELERAVRPSLEKGGVVLIPAFAVGRSQSLLLLLNELLAERRIPDVPVHLDSPMAIDATEIYLRHSRELDAAGRGLARGERALYGRNVQLHRTREESQELNDLNGPRILISSSGMLTGGRVLHHVKRLLPDPKATVLFAGYQAAGTRGRALLDGARAIHVHREEVPVRARVEDLGTLSGHGDSEELLRWTSGLPRKPRRTFLTHGEPQAAKALQELLLERQGVHASIPGLGDEVEVGEGASAR